MEKEPKIELYSEDVNVLISARPSPIMRYGIGVIFMILLCIIIICTTLRYPEIISMEAHLIYDVPIEELKTEYSGIIIDVHEGIAKVQKGDTLATISIGRNKKAYIISSVTGMLYPNPNYRKGDCVSKETVLYKITEEQIRSLTVKTYIAQEQFAKIKGIDSLEITISNISFPANIIYSTSAVQEQDGKVAVWMALKVPQNHIKKFIWKDNYIMELGTNVSIAEKYFIRRIR